MKCPLQFHPDYVNLHPLNDCITTECAVWNSLNKCCSVVCISHAIMGINQKLSDVLDPPKEPQPVSDPDPIVHFCDGCDYHEISTTDSNYHYCSKYRQRCFFRLNDNTPRALNICLQEHGWTK